MGIKFSTVTDLPVTQLRRPPAPAPEQQANNEILVIRSEEMVFFTACTTAVILLQLPMEYIDGNPVPTIIFRHQPSSFHAFILGLTACSYSAACSIYLRERNPKVARFYRFFAHGAMLLTAAILLWAAIPARFKFGD